MATSDVANDPDGGARPQTHYKGSGRQQATDADTASRTPNSTHEPRALRDWKWREDADANNNPCHKGDGRGGTGYINLRKGDLVWTGRCSGPAPEARGDGIPWRFGLNLQTARSGWFPCTFAVKPAKQFLFPIKETEEITSTRQAPTNADVAESTEPLAPELEEALSAFTSPVPRNNDA